jgi:hypothetical protein
MMFFILCTPSKIGIDSIIGPEHNKGGEITNRERKEEG